MNAPLDPKPKVQLAPGLHTNADASRLTAQGVNQEPICQAREIGRRCRWMMVLLLVLFMVTGLQAHWVAKTFHHQDQLVFNVLFITLIMLIGLALLGQLWGIYRQNRQWFPPGPPVEPATDRLLKKPKAQPAPVPQEAETVQTNATPPLRSKKHPPAAEEAQQTLQRLQSLLRELQASNQSLQQRLRNKN